MMSIADQYIRSAAMVIHGLLIPVGIFVILLGFLLSHVYDLRQDIDEAENKEIFMLSLIIGFMDFIIGICGVCAALMKLRALQIVNASLLTLGLIMNLVFLVICLYFLHASKDVTRSMEHKKQLFKTRYGNSSDSTSESFTTRMNEFHKTHSCCGWTGIDGENVYINTPWHKLINANVTAAIKPRTLPESCCIKANDTSCQMAENVKEARKKGLVYKKDCLQIALDRQFTPYKGYMIQIGISMVLQIPGGILTVKLLLPTE